MDKTAGRGDMTPMDTSHIRDVIVIGGGPVGAAAALLCAARGLQTALADARPPGAPPPPDLRNFAVMQGGWELLASVGAAPAEEDVQVLRGLEATGPAWPLLGAPGVRLMPPGTEAASAGEGDVSPPMGRMVPARVLDRSLRAALEASDVELFASETLTAIEETETHAIARFASGLEVGARCVAGADGRNSAVRRLTGIAQARRDYGQSVFTANVGLDAPHDGIARQWFLSEGPFAALPLLGQRANLACYMRRGAAERLAALPPDAVEAELNARYGGLLGPMRLERESGCGAYPLQLALPEALSRGRCALLGDAARTITPLAGQGLNLGLDDARAFAEALREEARAGLPLGSAALERYADRRRGEADAASLGLDAIDRIYSNANPLLAPVRGAALALAAKLPGVASGLSRYAMRSGGRAGSR